MEKLGVNIKLVVPYYKKHLQGTPSSNSFQIRFNKQKKGNIFIAALVAEAA